MTNRRPGEVTTRKWEVFLADDHAVLREGLLALIDAQPDMHVIGSTDDGRDLVQHIQHCAPDVVVMDISMPQVNGIKATAQLREHCPQVQVVVLTRHSEHAYVRQLVQVGARGYVLKQSPTEELLTAVRTVAAGGYYLDRKLSNVAVSQFMIPNSRTTPAAVLDLSEREQDVVRLTARGYSNKEIANQLGLSVKTIDTYKARAMEKLNLHSRAGLVQYALQQGWLDNL